jgi:hypothetical protein
VAGMSVQQAELIGRDNYVPHFVQAASARAV